mgnify:CR=1 FL=1
MRAFAELVMRCRMHAIIIIVLMMAAPMLFWLGAAAASLVLMRRGPQQAAQVVLWGALPGVVWASVGDPRALAVYAISLLMAYVLRQTVSLGAALGAGLVAGTVGAVLLAGVYPEPIEQLAAKLSEFMPQMLGGMYEQLSATEQQHLTSLIIPVLTGLFATVMLWVSVLSLTLARYWQAALYNPGGFAAEFRSFRLSPKFAIPLVLVMFFAPNLGVAAAMLTPLCSVPLAFAGVALIHGWVAKRGLSKFALVMFYIVLFLFMQFVYPLLVILALGDSLFDFRRVRSR